MKNVSRTSVSIVQGFVWTSHGCVHVLTFNGLYLENDDQCFYLLIGPVLNDVTILQPGDIEAAHTLYTQHNFDRRSIINMFTTQKRT